MDEIKVRVSSWGEGRPLALRWTDPVSGRRKAKSSGTTDWRVAERAAVELEKQLAAGANVLPSRITWKAFRQRFRDEKLAGMCEGTRHAYEMSLDHLERRLHPDRLAKITTPVMSGFAAKLLSAMRATTANKVLRHCKAACRWAERQGYLAKAPRIELHKAPARMKGRPVTTEEYERMLGDTAAVRPHDAEQWQRFITGLWLSGLRLGEAVALDWNDGDFQMDLGGKHPCFRIQPEGQKAGRAEMAPCTPDFVTWLLDNTPESLRVGKVLPLVRKGGRPFAAEQVGRIVRDIGKKARVVVDRSEKIDRKGKRGESVKFASAHDLRRGFGTRWSKRVMPPALQALMRHSHYSTTAAYYVGASADEVASDLWRNHAPQADPASHAGQVGNKSGNIGQNTASREASENERKPLQHNK